MRNLVSGSTSHNTEAFITNTMGRTVVAGLLLAHSVASAIEIPGNFANLAAAAATTDPAVTACSIAYGVIDSCYSASPGLSTAPESDAASCLCCHSTVEIDEYYSICADYISASYPRSSTQYSAFTGLADACASEMPVCGAGAGGGGSSASLTAKTTAADTVITATTVTSATRTTGGAGGGGSEGSGTGVPDVCTSFQDIISSCVAATPSITGAPDSIAASCLCYTTAGGTSSFTTEIDDLASSCAVWAKTAVASSAYSAITGFEDFCASYSPTGTRTRTPSTTSTDTDTETSDTTSTSATTRTGGIGGGSGSGTTTSRTATTAAATTTSTRATGNVASPAGAGGLVVWTAELFSFVLSFFLII